MKLLKLLEICMITHKPKPWKDFPVHIHRRKRNNDDDKYTQLWDKWKTCCWSLLQSKTIYNSSFLHNYSKEIHISSNEEYINCIYSSPLVNLLPHFLYCFVSLMYFKKKLRKIKFIKTQSKNSNSFCRHSQHIFSLHRQHISWRRRNA